MWQSHNDVAKHTPIIGLLFNNLVENYEGNIWKGIVKAAELRGVNLISFLGGALKSPENFDVQRNILYNTISNQNVDGLIAISGSIGMYITSPELSAFFKTLPDVPFVSIGVPVNHTPSILVDNENGIKKLVTHLIKKHKKRRIAFIRGPENNADAEMRFLVYKKILKAYHIPYDPALVVNGNFSRESGRHAITVLCKKRNVQFDALISANDYMAMSAIQKLHEYGIHVPRDVAVAGFDDIEEASCFIPSLTTVSQPYDEIGNKAVDTILKLIAHEVITERVVFSTQLIIRPSCGCYINDTIPQFSSHEKKSPESCKMEELGEYKERIIEEILRVVKKNRNDDCGDIDFLKWCGELFDGIVQFSEKVEDDQFFYTVERLFLGYDDQGQYIELWFYIMTLLFSRIEIYCDDSALRERLSLLYRNMALYKQTIVMNYQVHMKVLSGQVNRILHNLNHALLTLVSPDQLKTILSTVLPLLGIKNCYCALYQGIYSPDQDVRLIFSLYPNSFPEFYPPRTIVPQGILSLSEHFNYVMVPLFYREVQLGFILFEPGPLDGMIYQTLTSQIAGALIGVESITHARNQVLELETEVKVHRETEAALQKQQQQALVALNSITEGVITIDTKSIITFLNPVAEKLTGWTYEEALGRPLKEVFRVKYNLENEMGSENVDIVLGQDRGLKLTGSILLKSRDGSEYLIKESISPIKEGNNTLGVVIVIHDVDDRQKISQFIDYQTTFDILSGLYNRKTFNKILTNHLLLVRETKKEHILCFISVDSYSHIINSLGDIAGDELIRHVTKIIKNGIRASDILSRIGDDLFGLILDSCPLHQASAVAETLKEKINESPLVVNNTPFRILVNIGITRINRTSGDTLHVINKAHLACQSAKKSGGNRVYVYTQKDDSMFLHNGKATLFKQISHALACDHFCLYRQRIAPLGKSGLGSDHYEILVRMKDEEGNIFNPDSFIPAAEQYNIMPQIDRWVIKKLFSSYVPDYNEPPQNALAKYSINLSGLTLNDDSFLDFVFEQFQLFDIPPITICFEITETAAITNFSQVIHFIKELKRIGCYFSLDDFGSGWTSFSYLKRLPVDFLKIDGSFVKEIVQDPLNFILVETINHLGHMMGLQTIAEYVENDDILNALKKIGVNFVQGYGIARPEPF
ncbi:MAG: EAL domain-containing protein [Spirochaetales bacterium]|nr:EAL domain-containing protein [Spirochaetales bacterium]